MHYYAIHCMCVSVQKYHSMHDVANGRVMPAFSSSNEEANVILKHCSSLFFHATGKRAPQTHTHC